MAHTPENDGSPVSYVNDIDVESPNVSSSASSNESVDCFPSGNDVNTINSGNDVHSGNGGNPPLSKTAEAKIEHARFEEARESHAQEEPKALKECYIGTGSSKTAMHGWHSNVARDSLATYISHPPFLQYSSDRLEQSREQTRIQCLEGMIQPIGPPPHDPCPPTPDNSSAEKGEQNPVVRMSQLPEYHFGAPRGDGPLPNGMRFCNGFGLYADVGPLQINDYDQATTLRTSPDLQVNTMQYDQGYRPALGAGNHVYFNHLQNDNGSQSSFTAGDNPLVNEHGYHLASRTSQFPQLNSMAHNQVSGASAGAGHNDLNTADYPFAFDDGAGGGNADLSMPGFDNYDASGACGYSNYESVSDHSDLSAGNNAYCNVSPHRHDEDSGDETASDDSFGMLAALPLPPSRASFEVGHKSVVKKEDVDDTYIDDGEESDYTDGPGRKRKRTGTKTGVETEKRNKDGQPRKSRAPRAPLRRWDENDLIKALIGIVWACGEAGLQIPFDQSAQLIDDTCTASALQQAILKLHAQMIKEGKQLPKIKMHWPKKGGDRSNVVLRDASKLPRRKPTMRKITQSFVITLKRAYIEADRALLDFPYGSEQAGRGTGSAASFATGGRTQTVRPSTAYVSSPQNDQVLPTPQHVSPYATVHPTSDYLPHGFLHVRDQFQYQPRRATLPSYPRQEMHIDPPGYFHGARQDLNQDTNAYGPNPMPDSLSLENAQMVGGTRRSLSSAGIQPNRRGQDTLGPLAMQTNNRLDHYEAGRTPRSGHHRHGVGFPELVKQPLQAPASPSASGESQNQGTQRVRYQLSGVNNFIYEDELDSNFVVPPQIDAYPGQEGYPDMRSFIADT